MQYAKKQRRVSLIITLVGAVFFVVIALTTIVWATGIKFNATTGGFEKTAIIAVDNSLDDVTISLDGKVVGNATPITLDGLSGGRYDLTITKAGFYPYEKIFQLSPGQAGVVKKAVLIAQQPQTSSVADAVYLNGDPFDVGLVFQNNQLLDYGSLITRFSTPIIQAHRFDTSYLYQQGSDLHLYFAENSQDITIYHANTPGLIKLNFSPSTSTVTIFGGPLPIELRLDVPSAATAQP